jgi:hypothetical protein
VVPETGKTIWDIGSYSPYFQNFTGQLISLAGFASLAAFCYFYAKGRTK